MSTVEAKESRRLFNFGTDISPDMSEYFRYVGLLTLVFTLTSGSAFPPYTKILALAAILIYPIFTSKWLWPSIFAIALLAFLSGSIWTFDNHEWSILYWFLTLAIFSFVRKDELLQSTARYLIGFIFFFATSWKIAAEDFRTFAFFEITGNTEPRFTQIMVPFGLMPPGVSMNNPSIERWKDPEYGLQGFTLITGDALENFWTILTLATYAVEGGLAIAFLYPLAKHQTWIRDALLAAFFVGTYVMVPVSGFGNLLAVMGFAASNLDLKKRAYVYGGLIVLMEIIPTRMLLLDLLGLT
ncbi:MAG: hypothetical protein ACO3P3_01015 [Candidatus Nanopelagicales bacterium]